MILYYFPIAQNTGPVELRFGSNLFSDRLLSVIISRRSQSVIMGTVSEIYYFITGSVESCLLQKHGQTLFWPVNP